MDTFRIDIPFNKNDFIRINLIRWKIISKKSSKQIFNFFIASIILLSLGIITKIGGKSANSPVNPFLFLGILSILFTLSLFFTRIRLKQKYINKMKENAERFDSVQMDCSYEFSDESIKYWDKEKRIEYNWSLVKNYSIYKNYLIINLDSSLIESYIFEYKGKDVDEYNRLLEIVKMKLEYKSNNGENVSEFKYKSQ